MFCTWVNLLLLKIGIKTKPYRLLGESSNSLLAEWLSSSSSSSSSSSFCECWIDPAGLIFRGGGVRLRWRLDDIDDPDEWGEIFCSTSSRVREITPGVGTLLLVLLVDVADGLCCRPCCSFARWWWWSTPRWVEGDDKDEAPARDECVELWLLDGTGCGTGCCCCWCRSLAWWSNGWGEMDGLKCSDAGWFFCTDRGGVGGACDLVTVISPFDVVILLVDGK